MVIVNSQEKWVKLQKVMKTTHFVYLQILSDVQKHPKENRVSCFYIVTPFEKYIVPVNHNEKFGTIEKIDVDDSKVCVGDMKSFLHNSMIECDRIFGLIDLNWCHYNKTNEPYDFDKHLTNAHHHNYRVHYDKENVNRLVNLLPAHIKYDNENSEFLTFMDMIGHHYDNIWTHIKAMTDVHDRSEDVTTGISATLVKPIAESLGFQINEGRDLVSLPQYHLGLAESGSNTGVYNVRYTKRSQKDLTREIWNRILATMPYMLKTKGTKQSLKSLTIGPGIS